ncbi:MAG: radical SAM protein, partial [Alphaproteobacteria bacterium]|nr:radical SAM protein [Alphaproteobacteria bacterium]
QVDTLCHRIPGFIEKCAKAGCYTVFIGLENINPQSLMGTKKRQNKIWEYRDMLQQWRQHKVMTWAGYILGFPTDTAETIARDIEIIKRELPIDILEFFCLTPLPGSEDHKRLAEKGVPMDPDMNNYDLEHVTTAHAIMSREAWEQVYRDAWARYYTDSHVATVLRRAIRDGLNPKKIVDALTIFSGSVRIEGVHPLQFGFLRRKRRRERRHGLPLESPLVFYPRRLGELALALWRWVRLMRRYRRILARVLADPAPATYTDDALRTEASESGFVQIFSEKNPRTYGAPKARSAAV